MDSSLSGCFRILPLRGNLEDWKVFRMLYHLFREMSPVPFWGVVVVVVCAIALVCAKRVARPITNKDERQANAFVAFIIAAAMMLTPTIIVVHRVYVALPPQTALIRDYEVIASFPDWVLLVQSDPRLVGAEQVNYQAQSDCWQGPGYSVGIYWSGTPEAFLPALRAARGENIRSGDYLRNLVWSKCRNLPPPEDDWLAGNRLAYTQKVRQACAGLPKGVAIRVGFDDITTLKPEDVPAEASR